MCMICRNVIGFMNNTFKAQQDEMKAIRVDMKASDAEKRVLQEKVKALEAEIRLLVSQIAGIQSNTNQVREKVGDMEKEIESGMEQAKKEVKEEMTVEMKEQEKKGSNIVVFGVKESEKSDPEEEKADDAAVIRKIAEEVDVEIAGEVEILFRAGKKEGASKPRPIVVKVHDDETREALKRKAYLLGRKDAWKGVFVAPDLTRKQREEARKKEMELREEADRLNEIAKNDGRTGGSHRVKTIKGERKVVWWEDR